MDVTETAAEGAGDGSAAEVAESAGEIAVETPAPVEADGVNWQPPMTEKDTGVALDGEYPVNHRLRAERMAADGLTEDPLGTITPEHIEDARVRLAAAEEARLAAEKARPPVSASMTVKALERIAEKETIDLSTADNNDDRVRLIEEHRAANPPAPSEEG